MDSTEGIYSTTCETIPIIHIANGTKDNVDLFAFVSPVTQLM